jgi:hypothetical protein
MEGMLPRILRRESGRVNSKYGYFLNGLDRILALQTSAPRIS